MPDTKITALAAITTVDPAADVLPIVDISDTSMAASGTTKKITSNQILGAGGTATLAAATITGDLTVDTSTLKVNSSANQVGVGITTFTGAQSLQVLTGLRVSDANPESLNCLNFAVTSTTSTIETRYGTPLIFGTNATECYRIASGGTSTWSVGGSTAMTLNSTGLGVGVSPSYKLDVLGVSAATVASGAAFRAIRSSSGDRCLIVPLAAGSGFTIQSQNAAESDFTPIIFSGSTTTFNYRTGVGTLAAGMMLDSSGNVGIGVTPVSGQKLTVLTNAGISATTATAADDRLIFTENMASANLGSQIVWKNSGNGNAYASIGFTNGAAGNNGSLIFSTSSSIFGSNNVERMRIDSAGNPIFQPSATPATLGTNGMLTVNATSNTNLRFSYRGSDGVTRVANITLA